MHDIISDRNSALMCKLSPYNTDTFKAYDYDNDNRVSKKQFIQLIEDSWRFAFRILAQKCDGTQYGKLTIRDLENWSTSKIQNLNDQSTKLFNKLDPLNTGVIFRLLCSLQNFRVLRNLSLIQDLMILRPILIWRKLSFH